MARSARSRSSAPTPAQQVSVWEDDPEPGVRVTRPLPDSSKRPLAFTFPGRAPAPGGAPGTASFRYWTAAECLRLAPIFGRRGCLRGIGSRERACACCSTKAST